MHIQWKPVDTVRSTVYENLAVATGRCAVKFHGDWSESQVDLKTTGLY